MEIKPLTFAEAVEAIRYEDEMMQSGVGAVVRIALGVDEPEIYTEAACLVGYREFEILATIFASFGKTIDAREYDQLLKAIDLGYESEDESEDEHDGRCGTEGCPVCG